MTKDDDLISLAQARDTPTALAYRLLSDSLLTKVDAEIRRALERATGLQLPNRRSEMIEVLRSSGHRLGVRYSPDGTEAFYVDNVLVLTFGPTELSREPDNVVVASRRVRHWAPA